MAYADDQNPSGLNDFGTVVADISSCYAVVWSNTNSEVRRIDWEEILRGFIPTVAHTPTGTSDTLTSSDQYTNTIEASASGDMTITLPDPTTVSNKLYGFQNLSGGNALIVTPASGDAIGSLPANKAITLDRKGDSLILKAYGGDGWVVVSGHFSIRGTASTSVTVPAGGWQQVTVTVTGVVTGSPVAASISYAATSPAINSQDLILSACATAADTVTVNLFNPTGADIALSSHTVTAWLVF